MTSQRLSNSDSETYIEKMNDGKYQCISNSLFIRNFLNCKGIYKIASIKIPKGNKYQRYSIFFVDKDTADSILVELKLLEDSTYVGSFKGTKTNGKKRK